jgi:hypothetical protein
MYIVVACLITYIHCIITIMKSFLEDRNNNNYCAIPLATSARSSSVVSTTMSWSPWYISPIFSCLCVKNQQCAGHDTYLLPCYYLLQNLLQLTNSNLSFWRLYTFSAFVFHYLSFHSSYLNYYYSCFLLLPIYYMDYP